jgi:dynein heavy chain
MPSQLLQLLLPDLSHCRINRPQWIKEYPAQVALVGGQCWWTTEVAMAFEHLEDGNENAMRDYNKKQVDQLVELIKMIQGDLEPDQRQKVMTICTIEVHARDVIAALVRDKQQNSSCFAWQSQLRHRWDDEKEHDCIVEICDARFRYSYEYLGNAPRLVITPLTDRCCAPFHGFWCCCS